MKGQAGTRRYVMRARAQSAAETRQRILDAATNLLTARLRSDIRLDDVAEAAGVSVPTVLRAFGSRAELLDLALTETLKAIRADFADVVPGDIAAAVTAWFDHYERFGDLVVRNLADESDPTVAPMVRIGRRQQRRGVRYMFGPQLARVPKAHRHELVDALVCASDVYTWKRLRRDMGRSRRQAESVMRRMITRLLEPGGPTDPDDAYDCDDCDDQVS